MLFVQSLGRSSKVVLAKHAWSGRERLGLLRVRNDVLVLHAMHWPDEIRDPTELLPPPVQVSDEEIEGALALMDTLTVDQMEGPDFQDRYTEAITQIIQAKREEQPLSEAPEPEEPSQVLDLMSDGRAAGIGVQGQGGPRRDRRRGARTAEAEEGRREEDDREENGRSARAIRASASRAR
ncbi:Ku protein [Streptomyces sp. NPDC001480]|uniref:Ku protein n=1 Tax=Streptomyces sp. NPDC001480 TaxID=3364577 RepID=UPI0036A1E988